MAGLGRASTIELSLSFDVKLFSYLSVTTAYEVMNSVIGFALQSSLCQQNLVDCRPMACSDGVWSLKMS